MTFRSVSLIMVLYMYVHLKIGDCYNQGSCKEIKTSFPHAPSGIYHIRAGSYNLIEVYCEMGLNGGGYTFLSPQALKEIEDEDLQSLITDRKSVLMRIRRCDGTQPYTVLEQLPLYRSIPLMYALTNFTGYQGPLNLAPLGGPFLFVGFLPKATAAARTLQGIMANGVPLTFTNCDSNPNSYITIFPNSDEKVPTSYAVGADFPFCNNIFNGAAQNPSTRVMPPQYFMFAEFHFGGCGCYSQADVRLRNKCILGFQIGFR